MTFWGIILKLIPNPEGRSPWWIVIVPLSQIALIGALWFLSYSIIHGFGG